MSGLYHYFSCVFASEGYDCPSDKIGGRVACGASLEADNSRPLDKSHVHQPAAHTAAAVHCPDRGCCALGKAGKCCINKYKTSVMLVIICYTKHQLKNIQKIEHDLCDDFLYIVLLAISIIIC